MRRIRIFLRLSGVLFLALIAAGVFLFYDIMTNPRRLEEKFLGTVRGYFREDTVRIDSAYMLEGNVVVEGFVVHDSSDPDQEFINVPYLEIKSGGLLDFLNITQVIFRDAVLRLSKDESGEWNFNRLIDFAALEEQDRDEEGGDPPPDVPSGPKITFKDLTVAIHDASFLASEKYHECRIEEINLTPDVRHESVCKDPHYDVFARDIDDEILGHGTLEGWWNLEGGQGDLVLDLERSSFRPENAVQFDDPIRDFLETLSLEAGGEIAGHVNYERSRPEPSRLHYEVSAKIHGGEFYLAPVSDRPIEFSGSALFQDGVLKFPEVEARWEDKTLRLKGSVGEIGRPGGAKVEFKFRDRAPDLLLDRLFGPDRRRLGIEVSEKEEILVEGEIRSADSGEGVDFDARAHRVRRYEGPGSGAPAVEAWGTVRLERASATPDKYSGRYVLSPRKRESRKHDGNLEIAGVDHPVRVSGSLAPPLADPAVDLEFETLGWRFESGLREIFGPAGDELFRALSPEGGLELGVQVKRERGEIGSMLARPLLVLKDASFAIEGFRRRVEGVWGRVRFDGDRIFLDGARARFGPAALHVPRAEFARGPDGRVALVRLAAEAKDLILDEELLGALGPEAREIVRIFDPKGRFRARVEIDRDPMTGAPVRQYQISPQGMSARHARFPIPLSGVTGTIRVNDEARVQLDLAGSNAPGAKVTARGWVEIDENGDIGKADVRIDATNAPLSTGDFALFSRSLSRVLATGTDPRENRFDLSGNLRTDRFGDLEPDIVIQPRRVTLLFDEFAYPFRGVSGEMRIRPTGIGLMKLVGQHERGEFRLQHPSRAEFEDLPRSYAYRLRAECDDIPLDADLRRALRDEEGEIWKEFSPDGKADIRFLIDREFAATDIDSGFDLLVRSAASQGIFEHRFPDEDRTASQVEISLKDARISYKDLPYPLEHVKGKIRIRGDRVDLEGVKGDRGATSVSINGRIEGRGERRAVDIHVVAPVLSLDEALRKALGPEWQDLWDRFRPEGSVEVDARFSRAAGDKGEATPKIVIRPPREGGGVRFVFESFPYPLTIEDGRVILGEGPGPILEGLRARNGEATIELSGEVLSFSDSSQVHLAVDISDLLVNEELRAAIERNFPGVWDTLKPSGRLVSARIEVEASQTPDGAHQVEYFLRAALGSASMVLGSPVENLSASGWARGWIRDGEHHLQDGEFRDLTFDMKGVGFRGLAGRLTMEGTALSLNDLSGSVMGGSFEDGRMVVDTGPLHAFEADFLLRDIDLRRTSRVLFPEENPEEGEGSELAGSVNVGVELAGVAGDLDSLKARGFLEVRDGRLWDLPVFLAIFDVFELPEKPAFREGRMEYTLAERRFRISNAIMKSNPMDLYGEGAMDLDGNLDLYFVSDLAPGVTPRVPVVSTYWRRFKKNMIPIHVTGTVEDPQTAFVPFRFFQEMASAGAGGEADPGPGGEADPGPGARARDPGNGPEENARDPGQGRK
ncbi:MAG: hypothetical protein HY720_32865 [Planctomycetes bacterium]|nr:hypothetical protein [Planctomycetota bacterium]